MTNAGNLGDRSPIAASGNQAGANIGFEDLSVHAPRIASSCYSIKQQIASRPGNTPGMQRKPINAVLAENLAHFMREKQLTQSALARLTGMGQTTVSLYLRPEARQPSATGKIPSAKLSEVESLANALGVSVWELVRPRITAELPGYDRLNRDDQANIEQTLITLVAGKLASYESEKKGNKSPSDHTIDFEIGGDNMDSLEAALETAKEAAQGRPTHASARKRGNQSR
jgi:transcriptional regulator with XRE-family HTH domain